MKIIEWHDCYNDSWKGLITKDSFSHPAKFSRGLIAKIFWHCLESGYLKQGDLVGDPFGGIGTGGIMASYLGIKWFGLELEPRFVAMAEANFALHGDKIERMLFAMPTIEQGDSRKFDEVIAKLPGVVTSPPFTQGYSGGRGINKKGYGPGGKDKVGKRTYQGTSADRTPGNIENLPVGKFNAVVTSPPYSGIAAGAGGLNTKPAKKPGQQSGRKKGASQEADQRYGTEPGQISKLKDKGLSAVVTSPPYVDSLRGQKDGIDWEKAKQNGELGEGHGKGKSCNASYSRDMGKSEGQIAALPGGSIDAVVTSPPWEENCEGSRKGSKLKNPLNAKRGHGASDKAVLAQAERDEKKIYGESPGQIGKLDSGRIDGVVTSPPWEQSLSSGAISPAMQEEMKKRGHKPSASGQSATYGKAEGQIGQEKGETYWHAMHAVYAACFRSIRPGGIIAVVVKDYVKKKQVVPLSDDTARLLEHCGFTVIERIHAMLVADTKHPDLFLGETTTTRQRKSFFRRLAEKKGSPKIDFEEVIFARRP